MCRPIIYMEDIVKQESFKERVQKEMIDGAWKFQSYFINYEYLICSAAFNKRSYYIINAYEDNYLHLTGVTANIGKKEFFDKCLNGTLQEADFSFIKRNKSEKEVKGSVRRKIKAFSGITQIFSQDSLVEENYKKNRIECSFAIGNEICVVGFSISDPAKPMTLLKSETLDDTKAKVLDVVLRRCKGEIKFDTLILGDRIQLKKYIKDIENYVSDDIIEWLN